MQQALRIADIALVPVQPSPVDIWATVHVETEVEQALQHNPRLKSLLVINQLEPRSALSRAMQQALAEFDVPSLQNWICRRAIYRTSAIEGNSVFGSGKRGLAARQEIESIIEEVI